MACKGMRLVRVTALQWRLIHRDSMMVSFLAVFFLFHSQSITTLSENIMFQRLPRNPICWLSNVNFSGENPSWNPWEACHLVNFGTLPLMEGPSSMDFYEDSIYLRQFIRHMSPGMAQMIDKTSKPRWKAFRAGSARLWQEESVQPMGSENLVELVSHVGKRWTAFTFFSVNMKMVLSKGLICVI